MDAVRVLGIWWTPSWGSAGLVFLLTGTAAKLGDVLFEGDPRQLDTLNIGQIRKHRLSQLGQSDPEAHRKDDRLDHFPGFGSQDMGSQDQVGAFICDELYKTPRVPGRLGTRDVGHGHAGPFHT